MEGDDPYFGKLSAELLGQIAAALPLKEAARTSVLSRPWRNQWKESANAPSNRHFVGNVTTKFTPDGYPISCFDTVDEFLIWADRVIRRRGPFPLHRPIRTRLTRRRTEFSIESLALNFEPGDPDYGWIEFNKDRSSTTAPLVDGACTCCRSRAVSFLRRGNPPPHSISLIGLLSGIGRRDLVKRLTLRNFDMEVLWSQFTGLREMGFLKCRFYGPGNSFRSLTSLMLQKGSMIETVFLSKLIYGCHYLKEVTLEDCSIVDNYNYAEAGYVSSGGLLVIINIWTRLLRLTRCSGLTEIIYMMFAECREMRYDIHRPMIDQETVEVEFISIKPLQPDEGSELPPEVEAMFIRQDDEDEDDDILELETSLPKEEADEVALRFYDGFDYKFS